MKLFVSYSSRDGAPVASLVERLEQAGHQVWFDRELRGGDAWWSEILQQIRDCEAFVFAESGQSLRSRPCQAERDYATALLIPMVSVPIASASVDSATPAYAERSANSSDLSDHELHDLLTTLQNVVAERPNLPQPLPEPPDIPFEYLIRLGQLIRDPAWLSPPGQASTIFELKSALADEQDPDVRADITSLLHTFRARRDVTHESAREIDTVLGGPSPGPSTPRPGRAWPRHRRIALTAAAGVAIVTGVSVGVHQFSSERAASESPSVATASVKSTASGSSTLPSFDLSQCRTGADANRVPGCAAVATMNFVDAAWRDRLGTTYSHPDLLLFDQYADTPCGPADVTFYCPDDQRVYVALGFVGDLVAAYGSDTGGLAVMYVTAHTAGHHVQSLSNHDDAAVQGDHERTELQADCYAGIAFHDATATPTRPRGEPPINPLSEDAILDAITATRTLGDDAAQPRDGEAIGESWRYASPGRRQHWFLIGYRGGDASRCDTYNATTLG